jgi:UrcA family protein
LRASRLPALRLAEALLSRDETRDFLRRARFESSRAGAATFFDAVASEKYARRHSMEFFEERVMSVTSAKLSGVARTRLGRCSWAAFGTASALLFAASVQAGTVQSTYELAYKQYSTTVSYADLDLSSSADAKVLYSRLRTAAKAVCGEPDARNLSLRRLARECYESALSNAVVDLDNANVTALHATDRSIRVAQRNAPNDRRS